ncbi:hypothetical protein P353_16075 [Comamonas testosteroni]|uniref:Uncharacterized protein n=1 Tax=Comamonas testosteroni TaxID=285 RepID=A0A096FD35_COMTE|nr:hypothetical protein P353_16075 [Comamonas testosteroni]
MGDAELGSDMGMRAAQCMVHLLWNAWHWNAKVAHTRRNDGIQIARNSTQVHYFDGSTTPAFADLHINVPALAERYREPQWCRRGVP